VNQQDILFLKKIIIKTGMRGISKKCLLISMQVCFVPITNTEIFRG
jgi:hypothetical protein